MKWLTLQRIKQQCRIEQDFIDEDVELEEYGESAEDQVLNDIARTYEDLIETYGKIPIPLVHASLLLVDQSYRQRSAADTMSWSSVPYSYEHKIKPYMRLASNEYNNENEKRYGCNKL